MLKSHKMASYIRATNLCICWDKRQLFCPDWEIPASKFITCWTYFRQARCSLLQKFCFITGNPEKAMAPHSSALAWKIPWTEEPGGLQSRGREKSDTTERLHFHFSFSCTGEGNGNPPQCSCLENPRDRGAWWAAIYGVAQSRTRLKQLSSSSSSRHYFQKLFHVALNSVLVCILPHINVCVCVWTWRTGVIASVIWVCTPHFSLEWGIR